MIHDNICDCNAIQNAEHCTSEHGGIQKPLPKITHNIGHGFTGAEIIHGDLLHVLPTFPDKLFGGIICDPPYASGAADQNGKQKTTAQKYSSAKTNNILPNF
jgi:hypothetical protein